MSSLTGDDRSLDAMFRALADGHRRQVLAVLDDSGDALVDLDDIAAHVRSRTAERAGWSRLEAKLHHVDLPALTAAGVLEYDSERRTVRFRPDEQWTRVLGLVTDWGMLSRDP